MSPAAPSPVVVDRRCRPWVGLLRDRRVLQMPFPGPDRRLVTLQDLDRVLRRALP